MSEKGLYSPVVRRIITIVVLISIISAFIAIYYLIYLPQQSTEYNLRIFRILHEISASFKQRVENYGTVYSYNYINQKEKDNPVYLKDFVRTRDTVINENTTSKNTPPKHQQITTFLPDSNYKKRLDAAFISSFKGNALSINSFVSGKSIQQDSVNFFIDSGISKKTRDTISNHLIVQPQSLADILEPIITVHAATFESILLIKQKADSTKKDASKNVHFDAILYKSENADIANINTDSLFYNKNIQAPVISNLNIEGITYKMFLLPFKLSPSNTDTYVLAGIIAGETYREQSQSIPFDLLLSLCLVLIILLLILPFLKIFFLSTEESITVKDVRTIIVVVFIIPFFIVLVSSYTWLYLYRAKWTTEVLQHLQNSVENNFYNEINQSVRQLKAYDHIITHPAATIDTAANNYLSLLNTQASDSADLKDFIFYPKYYQQFTSIHWMNDKGNDIAVWTLINKLPPNYFQLSDRQYFKDIKYGRAYTLPTSQSDTTDSFGIQPALSRLTGEYTINVSTHSNAQLKASQSKDSVDRHATVVGLSSQMYSVWNTVIPKGFAFAIIDEAGHIICHSDTALNLQENLLEESSDSLTIRNVINHKDSTLLPDVDLYEQPVRMLICPMQGLPYYLVTYYNKRGEYLFLLHIIAFVFLCQSTLLLFASLFSYCMMMSDKRATKLLFTPADLNWMHPSADKKNYYLKNIYQCIACFIIFVLFATFYRVFYTSEDYYLFILNAAILLPLFVVTGYYMVKQSRKFIVQKKISTRAFTLHQYAFFLKSNISIVVLFITSILIFTVLKNVLFFNKPCPHSSAVTCGLWVLIIVTAVAITAIAGFNPDYYKGNRQHTSNRNYLTYFVIALLLAVMMISVVPTLTFTSYAFREEKILQLQSFQVDIAKKIQQRRTTLNQLYWKTKLNIYPFNATNYINDLKFSTGKGIYLLADESLDTIHTFGNTPPKNINCSPFYKNITQYLFLPPDHDEFYDDASHNKYYYWQLHNTRAGRQLKLFYNNTTDNKNNSSFVLTSVLPTVYLFKNFTGSFIGWMILLILFIFIFLFYKTIYSVTKRIFLIDFFKRPALNNTDAVAHVPEDTLWLQKSYKYVSLKEVCKDILPNIEKVNFAIIRAIENKALKGKYGEEKIIQLQLALSNVYEDIWRQCTDMEKYILYDFATDGFTNYKQTILLYELYKKGLIIKEEDENITLMTKSFRNFLITKQGSEEVKRISRQSNSGSWSMLRTVFYIFLIASAIFIFISQEEASKRLITIVTSLGALLPAILKLFDKSTFSVPSTGKSDNKT